MAKKKKQKTGCFTTMITAFFGLMILSAISKDLPEGSMSIIFVVSVLVYLCWLLFRRFDKPAKSAAQTRRDLGYDDNNDDDNSFEYAKQNTRANHKINNKQLNLFIEYKDAEENETERDVIVYGRTPYQPRGELRAFCELRRDFRTFKLNRIKTMVNKKTGEVINNKQKFIDDFYS